MKQFRRLLLAVAVALVGLILLSPTRSLGAPSDYVVAEGDTLSEIALRFGMSVEALAETNGIVDPDLILSGDVLLIPSSGGGAGEPGTEQIAGGGTYVVQFGDSLGLIAERFNVPVSAIADANGLGDPDYIVEGQMLVIPASVVESLVVRPYSPQTEALLDQFAADEGLDAALVKAMAYIESGWQQGVVSHTGAVGIMQIQPSTGYWLETEVFGFDLDIETSAYDNIRAGARYLRILMDLTDDADQAVAAYYQGYATLSAGILYEDTIRYVADVNAIQDWF